MWHLDGNVATASCGDVALTVGLAEGDRKLLLQTSDSTLLANLWMMPAVSPLPLVDVYVRGHDLVCSMGPTETHPFATQLYWTIRHLDVAPRRWQLCRCWYPCGPTCSIRNQPLRLPARRRTAPSTRSTLTAGRPTSCHFANNSRSSTLPCPETVLGNRRTSLPRGGSLSSARSSTTFLRKA